MSIVRDLVKRVIQSGVLCVKDATCDANVTVGCSDLKQDMREKRDVSNENMGFTVTLRNDGKCTRLPKTTDVAQRNEGMYNVYHQTRK